MLRWQRCKKKSGQLPSLKSYSSQLHKQEINFCCIQPPRLKGLFVFPTQADHPFFFKLGVSLLYNVVFVSAVQADHS